MNFHDCQWCARRFNSRKALVHHEKQHFELKREEERLMRDTFWDEQPRDAGPTDTFFWDEQPRDAGPTQDEIDAAIRSITGGAA